MSVSTLALAALAVLILVLLARAAAFKPRPSGGGAVPAPAPRGMEGIDAEAAARRLSELVQKRTVSSRDPQLVDYREYDAFIDLLPSLYPAAHEAMSRERVGGYSLLYRWRGSSAGACREPLFLMAHYDVVAADDAGWANPPFSGALCDGKVWGRGSLDTKCTLCCAFEAVEILARSGYAPERDLYLAFGHDEEIGGDGAPSIVALLEERGIRPGLVLDEGGGVVEGAFPGVKRPAALIGVAEKGITDFELSARSPGGHASTPPRRQAAAALAGAIVSLERKPFPARLSAPTLAMLGELGRHASFALRLVLANLWLFEPLLLRALTSSGGETNAMCRTTAAVTMLKGIRRGQYPARASAGYRQHEDRDRRNRRGLDSARAEDDRRRSRYRRGH